MDDDYTMFEQDLNLDAVKKKITEAKIGDALSSVKFKVSQLSIQFYDLNGIGFVLTVFLKL